MGSFARISEFFIDGNVFLFGIILPYSFGTAINDIESRPMTHNLWVATPLGVEQPFHRGHLRPLKDTDICITIHKSSKVTVMDSNRNDCKVGVSAT